jgi:hypothetical protein
MSGLSKSRILAHRQCPKRLWLQIHKPEVAQYDGQQQRFDVGNTVGEVARGLYPEGRLVENEDLGQCLTETQALLRRGKPIFEATFQHDGLLIRADLLLPDANGYRLAEVKSAASIKDVYLPDAAIQSWVARKAGIPLTHVEIAHIDRSFTYPGGGNYGGLLKHVDVTSAIAPLEAEIPSWINAARATLSGVEPGLDHGEHCRQPYECPFIAYCAPSQEQVTEYPVTMLPWGGKLAKQLTDEGYVDLRDVPVERLSKPLHQKIWRITKTKVAELDPEATRKLNDLPYPRYFLDFESIQFVVPIWSGTRPYDQVIFQWSCHIQTSDGALSHSAFLADGKSDPRRQFAENLLATIGSDGPVLVYNATFERGRLQELAAAFPDISAMLQAVIARLYDLLPLARAYYYHHDMQGSWSLKNVLPTIAPELDYENLAIGNGGMAMDAFSEILHPQTTAERRNELHEGLLAYCEQDTYAMVRIVEHFTQYNSSGE